MSAHFVPRPPETPRERLIEATITEIERHGLSQLTVRAVAAAADMNIAAVNYHFRSKQALVAAALESSILHMLEDTDAILLRLPEDPEGVFGELLGYYLEGCLRFPRLSKAHLHEAFVADDYSGTFPQRFAPVLERLRAALCKARPGLGSELAARRVIGALSGVFFPAFFGPLFQGFGALETPQARAQYALELARHALAPADAAGAGAGAAGRASGARRPATAPRRK
jgi:TetR/AcrR family transcriptional regulator, regulator of cefoperazone and chloramphenicol sensitivity